MDFGGYISTQKFQILSTLCTQQIHEIKFVKYLVQSISRNVEEELREGSYIAHTATADSALPRPRDHQLLVLVEEQG